MQHAPPFLITTALVALGSALGCTGEAKDAERARLGEGTVRASPRPSDNRRPAEQEGREEQEAEPADQSEYQRLMIRGGAAIYSGLFNEARQVYLRAMELQPDSMAPALGALRALTLHGHGEARAEVTRIIEKKIAAYRQQPHTQGAAELLAARAAIALGETGEALDRARLAVEHMPDLGVAWRVLGEAAIEAERWAEAVRALRKAASLGLKARPGTWERLADALDELGELEAAREAAEKALKLTGSDQNARRRRLNLLAVVLKHQGELDEALEVAEKARLLGPKDPAVLHNLGSIEEARGRLDVAQRLYQKALDPAPRPTTSWRLGHLYLKLDRLEDARAAFTAAAAHMDRWTWPASTRWWPAYELGRLYARVRRHDEAAGWFEDALREARTPSATREVRSWLAYVRSEQLADRGSP